MAQTDLLLVEDLHGIMLSRFSVPHQHNAAKRARAERFQPLKLLQASSVLHGQKQKGFCENGMVSAVVLEVDSFIF